MKTTDQLIRENRKYVRQTGYDLPGATAELRKRAAAGDSDACEYMDWIPDVSHDRAEPETR